MLPSFNLFVHATSGNSKQHIQSILSSSHSAAPRFDIAIHLRNQFVSFEKHFDRNDSRYKREVETWMNSSQCSNTFAKIEELFLKVIRNLTLDGIETLPLHVYIAADNAQVKNAMITRLERNPNITHHVDLMYMETKFVYHVKNLTKLKEDSFNEGMMDLTFDWYALSLADTILSWRGHSHFVSSFVRSAERVAQLPSQARVSSKEKRSLVPVKGYQIVSKNQSLLGWEFPLYWHSLSIKEQKDAVQNIAESIRRKRRLSKQQ